MPATPLEQIARCVEPPPVADAPLLPRTCGFGLPQPRVSDDSGLSSSRTERRSSSKELASASFAITSAASDTWSVHAQRGSGNATSNSNPGVSSGPGPGAFKQLLRLLSAEHEGTVALLREVQQALASSRKQLRESYIQNSDLIKKLEEAKQHQRGEEYNVFGRASTETEAEAQRSLGREKTSFRTDDTPNKQRHEHSQPADQLPYSTTHGNLTTASTHLNEDVVTVASQPNSGTNSRSNPLPGSVESGYVIQDSWVQGVLTASVAHAPISSREPMVHFEHRHDSDTTTIWSQRDGSEGQLFSEQSAASVNIDSSQAGQVRFPIRKHFSRYNPNTRRNSGDLDERGCHTDASSIKLEDEEDFAVLGRNGRCARYLVTTPASHKRVVWEILGALMILYDVIAIPLKTFDYPESTFTAAMDWITLWFWTMNIAASFCVGFVDKGVIIMAPQRIAAHYLKTWFFVDMVIILPDWVFTLRQTGSESGSSIKLLRIMRITRAIRLLRLFKMQWLFQLIDSQLDSEYSSIIVNIAKMMFLLLAINHFLACGWFAVAEQQSGSSWLTHEPAVYFEEDWTYKYATAFHWSITQFTPSSMDVNPRSLPERIYAIVVIVFALVAFSYVVGSITQSLTQLRSIKETEKKEFFMLRKYLKQNKLELALQLKVQKFAEHAWKRQNIIVPQASVQILNLLSEQLKKELRSAIFVPNMLVHPLFAHLWQHANVTLHRLAETAITRKQLARLDTLFFPSESAFYVYFVIDGRLQYVKMGQKPEWVDSREDWIAEPVLWTEEWVHLGQATAASHCDLLQVEAVQFGSIVQLNPFSMQQTTMFAKNYIKWLNEQDEEELSDICQGEDMTDTIRGFIEYEGNKQHAHPPPLKKATTLKSLFSRRESRATVSKVTTQGSIVKE